MSVIFSSLKKGEILSESSYFVIDEVKGDKIVVTDGFGNTGLEIGRKYVESILNSADQFTNEDKVSQTELINIVLANPRTAMTIYFQKANKVKTKKAFNTEKQAKIDEIQLAPASKVADLLESLMDNPILDYTPGEMREIKGYFVGTQDERGRFQFKDMEDDKALIKGVDSRTIQYAIVNDTKYSIKK